MSNQLVVDVVTRSETGKNVSRRLRRAGSIPAILYGEKKPPVILSVDPKAVQAVLATEAGENTLFQLRLDGRQDKTRHVMIRERQEDPVTGSLVHVDFIRIDITKKVEVEVPVNLVGIADGVKNDGGMLDFVGRSVEIRCLPSDIPEHLDVDVTPMKIGHVFRVKDLVLDPRFELVSEAETPLVVISTPKAEEEPAAAAAVEGEAAPAEGAEKAAEGEPKPEEGS